MLISWLYCWQISTYFQSNDYCDTDANTVYFVDSTGVEIDFDTAASRVDKVDRTVDCVAVTGDGVDFVDFVEDAGD